MTGRRTDPREAEIANVRSHLADLRGYYVRLFLVTGADGRSPMGEPRGGAPIEPPVPVNLTILDLICRTERDVDRVESFIRRELWSMPKSMRRDTRNRAAEPVGDLRLVPVPTTSRYAERWVWIGTAPRRPAGGVMPDQRVLDALRWIGEVLPDVLDGGYRKQVVDPLFELHRKSRSALGLSERAYALDSECPFCLLPSIVARPDKDLVVCGNPACRTDDGKPRVWTTSEVALQRADEERRARVRVPLPTTGDAPRWVYLPRSEVYPDEATS